MENASFETASVLKQAGVSVALQTGSEGHVPRVRVLLFEAAAAAANCLGLESALAASTIEGGEAPGRREARRLAGTGQGRPSCPVRRDPFEYATRRTGVVIEGEVVSQDER
jgi:hypothetical protein